MDQAYSASSEWQREEQVAVRLISAFDSVGGVKSVPFGLHFKLQHGWKIYWRSPGDAGLPPRLRWNGSSNIESVTIRWPIPQRFSVLGLQTLGYLDEVVLPIDIKLIEPGAATLKLQLEYLICEKICIPYVAAFELQLPAGKLKLSEHSNLLGRYRAKVPRNDDIYGLSFESAIVRMNGEKKHEITFLARAKDAFTMPDVFIEGPAGSFFGKPKVMVSQDEKTAELRVEAGGISRSNLEKDGLVVTLVDGNRSIEAKLHPNFKLTKIKDTTSAGQESDFGLLIIAIFALIGGLILNVMPCVLPVLSIKILGILGNAGKDTRAVRLGFLASAAGIIFSFVILAAGLMLVKASGNSIGWGIQFQQPVFLSFLCVVLGLFACNLFGMFEVRLPSRIGNLVSIRLQGDSFTKNFLIGALAALVATPCSAPFLGTAIGFALSQGWFEILLIFVFLGIGLAFPYLVVAVFPGMASVLPRPGSWMILVKYFLGFVLLATVTWLLFIIANLIGAAGAAVLGALIFTMGVFLALGKTWSPALGRSSGAIVSIICLTAIFLPTIWGPVTRSNKDGIYSATKGWGAFNTMKIQKLVAEGKTVLVDVTADWCITCQLNKRLVLDSREVVTALRSGSVIGMRADWTRPNDAISRYLESFGRYGIPFNVIYGPAKPNGVVLPELLTNNSLKEVFDQVIKGGKMAN